jgi:predicted glycosyltransferase
MALVNVHPDYLYFDGDRPAPNTFPAEFYADLLEYARERYGDSFWHPLPREMAEFVYQHRVLTREQLSFPGHRANRSKKIWIDLENTPHIPFFKPIVRELKKRGYNVVLTARDAFQTCEMATQSGLRFRKIGRHYGANLLFKVFGLTLRSLQLVPFVLKERPGLALNHGSRAQLAVSNSMHIPTVTIMDYEHSTAPPLARPLWEIVPDAVPDEGGHCKDKQRVLKYAGIKEDVYTPDFRPDPTIAHQLGLKPGNVIVIVRPPATEAHYHNPESEGLLDEVMRRIVATSGVQAVVLPRNKMQETEMKKTRPEWFDGSKVIIPKRVVDGMNLIWHSDLVVSGGGTMNREAAALGVPVYSIFRGKIGAVDRRLAMQGRLTLIESKEEVRRKIIFRARSREIQPDLNGGKALEEIVGHIETIIRHHYPD